MGSSEILNLKTRTGVRFTDEGREVFEIEFCDKCQSWQDKAQGRMKTLDHDYKIFWECGKCLSA